MLLFFFVRQSVSDEIPLDSIESHLNPVHFHTKSANNGDGISIPDGEATDLLALLLPDRWVRWKEIISCTANKKMKTSGAERNYRFCMGVEDGRCLPRPAPQHSSICRLRKMHKTIIANDNSNAMSMDAAADVETAVYCIPEIWVLDAEPRPACSDGA